MLKFQIKDLESKKSLVDTYTLDTKVSDLRADVIKKYDIKYPQCLYLIHKGQPMLDCWNLRQCNVKDDSVIHLVMNSRHPALCSCEFHHPLFMHLKRGVKQVYEELLQTEKKVTELEHKILCSICMASEINCILGCGHGYCQECAKRIEECSRCRSPKTSVKVIYL